MSVLLASLKSMLEKVAAKVRARRKKKSTEELDMSASAVYNRAVVTFKAAVDAMAEKERKDR